MTTEEVIEHYGGIKAVCRELDIHASAVYQWGEAPPMLRQYEIQVKTNNKLIAGNTNGLDTTTGYGETTI